MVEKVFISPNRVRAYGNIVNMKTGDDFTLVNSELTVTTDTVDGAEMTVFSMEVAPHISVSATNPYLVSGETTDLVVSLVNAFGSPLSGKTVTISDGTSSYDGITNNQGVYTLSDVSVSQDTTFTATYGSLSDSVTVEYYLFIDEGTTASHYDHWYINSYGTATVQSDGTKLLNTSGNTSFVMRSIIPSNKTISDANAYSYNPPFVVEFDIVETNGTSNSDAQVQIYSQQTIDNFVQAVTTGHYKIEVTSEEQKIWLDDTLINTTNLSLPNARITLRVRNGKYLIYKNFKVY